MAHTSFELRDVFFVVGSPRRHAADAILPVPPGRHGLSRGSAVRKAPWMHWRRMQRAPGSVRERVESTGQASDVLAPVRRLISSSFSLSALRKHIFHRPYEKPLKNPSQQNFAKEFALSSRAPGARVRRAVSLKAV